MYETNVSGLLKVTPSVPPHLRRQRSGHIMNFSSVAGAMRETASQVSYKQP